MKQIGGREGRAGGRLVPLLPAMWVLGAGMLPLACAGGHHRITAEMSLVAFQPAVIEATVGDTIVWINRDPFPHTATSGTGAAWTTPALASGDSGILIPTQKGDWSYSCNFHPTMHGRLVVR